MVTIKDVALLAGVSHGTASNVLNKRGNVSVEKILLVESAAKKLGYHINTQAQVLRKTSSNKVYLLVPYIIQDKYTSFISMILKDLYRINIEAEIVPILENADTINEIERIKRFNPRNIICFSNIEQLEIGDEYSNLIYINLWGTSTFHNISSLGYNHINTLQAIENIVANKTISDVSYFSYSLEDDSSFLSSLKDAIHKDINIFKIRDNKLLSDFFKLARSNGSEELIIFTSSDLANIYFEVCEWLGVKIESIIVEISEKSLFNSSDVWHIQLDIEKLAKLTLEVICNKDSHCNYYLESIIVDRKKSIENKDFSVIKLLTIESPMTDAIRKISGKYFQETNVQILIDTIDYSQLYKMIIEKSSKLYEYDIVRMDMAWLSEVDKTLLRNLDDEPLIVDIIKTFETNVQQEYSKIDNQTYAIPLDVSVQMLFYRRDLFNNNYFKRKYFEVTRKKLKVPHTYKEFDQISKFLKMDLIFKEFHLYGHTISNANDILSYSDFIPRVREFTNEISISNSNLRKLWKKYCESEKYSLLNDEEQWKKVAENFSMGKTLMEVLYSNYAFTFFDKNSKLSSEMIGVAEIPGGNPLLGGGCLTVMNKEASDSLRFIQWLYSEENLQILSHIGGIINSNRNSAVTSLQSIFPWLENFSNKIINGKRFLGENPKMNFAKEKEFVRLIKKGSLSIKD